MSENRQKRILIVEQQREFARVLTSGLELLDETYSITTVPSGEEAMLEFRTPYDLIVADYFLPGISGVEVIRKARFRMPDVKAIITSEQDIGSVHREAEEIEAEAVLIKPILQHDFLRAVRKAFGLKSTSSLIAPPPKTTLADTPPEGEDQPEPVAQPTAVQSDSVIPEVDEIAVSAILSPLATEVGAQAVLFVNRAGEVILKTGTVDASLKFGELVILLARNFVNTSTIATYIGDEFSPDIHYYDGSRHDIFSLSVGENFFVVLIFPSEGKSQMGPVMAWGRPKVLELAGLIADGKITSQAMETAPAPAPEEVPEAEPAPLPIIEPTPKKPERAEKPAARRRTAPPPAPISTGSAVGDAIPVVENKELEPVAADNTPVEGTSDELIADAMAELADAFGLDDLKFATALIPKKDFEALGTALNDVDINSTEDLDQFWEEAADDLGKVSEAALSLDEAVEMGFWDEE